MTSPSAETIEEQINDTLQFKGVEFLEKLVCLYALEVCRSKLYEDVSSAISVQVSNGLKHLNGASREPADDDADAKLIRRVLTITQKTPALKAMLSEIMNDDRQSDDHQK